MRVRSRLALAIFLLTGAAACSAILGIDPPPAQDESEAGATDASPGGDTSTGPVICQAIGDDDSGTYLPFVTSADGDAGWELFGTSQELGRSAFEFTGGSFDGRYVYFAGRNAIVVRFDTQNSDAGFEDVAAWTYFILSNGSNVVPGNTMFAGSVFDGRYLYLVPSISGTAATGVVARYDTKLPLTLVSSWTTYDLTMLPFADAGAPLKGFLGAVFDGRYVYFVPHADPQPDARLLRYDTLLASEVADAGDAGVESDAGDAGDAGPRPGPLGNPALWSWFDVSSTNVAASGFAGGVYTGNQVYFAPSVNNVFDAEVHGGASGTVARVQTDANFESASAYSSFDMTKVNGESTNYYGGAFDGRYVYFAPRTTEIVERFDTLGNFADVSSWSSYDLSREVDANGPSYGFAGAAFDGRFVYFVPVGVGFATVTRYDTLSTFTADCAWSNINLTDLFPTADASPNDFTGAIFDGQFVYLVPSADGVVARFQARKTPATLNPPIFSGSFL